MSDKDHISPVVDDEVLRTRIRKLIDESPPQTYFQRISSNPLASVIIGFLLTGLIGGLLTDYYTRNQRDLEAQRSQEQRESDRLREDKIRESDRLRADQQRESDRLYQERQKEIENQRASQQRESDRLKDVRQKDLEFQRNAQQRELELDRSFADEVNKIKIQKVAEVWGKLYEYQAELESSVYEFRLPSISSIREEDKEERERRRREATEHNDGIVERLTATYRETIKLARKNSFWFKDEEYKKIMEYAELIGPDAGGPFSQLAISRPDFREEIMAKLEKARETLDQLTKRMLTER